MNLKQFTEAQRLSWVLGALDIPTDCPTEDDVRAADQEGDDSPAEFAGWAEREFLGTAHQFIAMFDALTEIRAHRGEERAKERPAAPWKHAWELAVGDIIITSAGTLRVDAVVWSGCAGASVDVEVSDPSGRFGHDIPGAMSFQPGEPVTLVNPDGSTERLTIV